jgi:hypothetical protein
MTANTTRAGAVAALLVVSLAQSQTQQTTPAAPPPKRTTATPAPATAQPQPQTSASRWHLPFTHPAGGSATGNTTANNKAAANNNAAASNSAAANNNAAANSTQTRRLWNLLPGNHASTANAAHGTSAGSTASRNPFGSLFGHKETAPAPGPRPGPGPGQATAGAPAKGMRLASLDSGHAGSGAAQSQTFLGHPAPPGSREMRTASGSIVRTAADGSVLDVRNPKSGMTIHHALDGSRHVLVEQPDGSRIVAPSRGVPYVQHPYIFQARAFDHRTFYDRGQLTHQFYRPYNFGGTTLDVYAPQRFYPGSVYQWATSRYRAPLVPSWNYVSTSAPWFTHYRDYFTPETSYSSPLGWLTDFVLATSLITAYDTHRPAASQPSAPSNPAPAVPLAAGAAAPAPTAAITPQVKDMVADEVDRQVKQESVEARASTQDKPLPEGAGSVVEELNDREPHVFVVASDLDLVDPGGRRCMISEGDVVQVISAANRETSSAQAVVLASKGGMECERAAQVQIALSDLQEMQNHMRETIDQGMAGTSAGRSAATVTPAYAAAAPPPDANAAREIEQQQQIAAAAEG